jgi:hypothetical protein
MEEVMDLAALGNNRDFEILAQYNAECSRGIMHREDWCRQMAGIQARYNEYVRGMQHREPSGNGLMNAPSSLTEG